MEKPNNITEDLIKLPSIYSFDEPIYIKLSKLVELANTSSDTQIFITNLNQTT